MIKKEDKEVLPKIKQKPETMWFSLCPMRTTMMLVFSPLSLLSLSATNHDALSLVSGMNGRKVQEMTLVERERFGWRLFSSINDCQSLWSVLVSHACLCINKHQRPMAEHGIPWSTCKWMCEIMMSSLWKLYVVWHKKIYHIYDMPRGWTLTAYRMNKEDWLQIRLPPGVVFKMFGRSPHILCNHECTGCCCWTALRQAG